MPLLEKLKYSLIFTSMICIGYVYNKCFMYVLNAKTDIIKKGRV